MDETNFNKEISMQRYADLNDDSGVSSYDIGDSDIKVWFNRDTASYIYSYSSAGQYHLEYMKKLALSGKGLNTYIDRNVKREYEES
ncbi:MAG: hypothetical protein JKX81_01575 [Arenicella sp.]|nr:hypothetical protein [Arenicella sp.]